MMKLIIKRGNEENTSSAISYRLKLYTDGINLNMIKLIYGTVTDLAKFLGLSGSLSLNIAV